MADTPRIPAWTMTFYDATGSNGQMRGWLAAGTAAETALAYLISLAGAVSPVIDTVPVRASVTYRYARVPRETPDGEDRCTDQGVFILTSAADTLSVLSFAGISRSKLKTTGCFAHEQIDLEDSDVAAFVDAITTGIWCDPFGDDITAAIVGYLRQVR